MLLDLDPDAVHDMAAQIGANTTGMQCDVQDKSQVERCVAKVLELYQRIDILVSNAGIHRRVDPLDFDPSSTVGFLNS